MPFNDRIQWAGAVLIILGHVLNAVGPRAYPYNIAVFLVGTALFLWWAYRTGNRPQTTVNLISITIMGAGLYRAISG